MFGIFKKKVYLRDQIENFYDVHSHLLWGVDDGSQDAEATTAVVTELKELGFAGAYLTPHIIYGLYGDRTEDDMRLRMQEMPSFEGFEMRLAAEYFLDENFGAHVTRSEEMLGLGNGGDWVLVEYGLGAGRVSHLNELFELSLAGKNIIIAHPERYAFLAERHNMQELERLTSRNFSLQLNMLSLTGYHGEKSRRMAEELLLADEYTFVGSDTHSRVYTHAMSEGVISPKVVEPLKRLMENNRRLLWEK